MIQEKYNPHEEKYNPHEIEAKWQQYWEDNKTFKTEMDSSRPKSYVLEMFPYPSGNPSATL